MNLQVNNVLFEPLQVGALTLSNRIWMAPLTRLRSIEPGDIPSPLAPLYYQQRAGAGLIVSEATHISPQAKAMAGRRAFTLMSRWPLGYQ